MDGIVEIQRKISRLIKMVFIDIPNENIKSVFDAAMLFHACGEVKKDNENSERSGSVRIKEIIYDYKADLQKIKAAFLRNFNFNPWQMSYLHWWDFKSCFDDILGYRFENVAEIRSLDLSKYKGAQLAELTRMKKIHKIRTHEDCVKEKFEGEIAEVWKSGGDISEVLRKFGFGES